MLFLWCTSNIYRTYSTQDFIPRQVKPGVTVPACEVHNIEKSQSDAAVANAWLQDLDRSRAKSPIDPEISAVIDLAKPNFGQVKRIVTTAKISNQSDLELVHISGAVNIKLWVIQITAGLIYKKLGRFESRIIWEETPVYSPDWVPSEYPTHVTQDALYTGITEANEFRAEMNSVIWYEGEFAARYPPKLYRYQTCLWNSPSGILFQHTFYNSFTWYVHVDVPPEIVEGLF